MAFYKTEIFGHKNFPILTLVFCNISANLVPNVGAWTVVWKIFAKRQFVLKNAQFAVFVYPITHLEQISNKNVYKLNHGGQYSTESIDSQTCTESCRY